MVSVRYILKHKALQITGIRNPYVKVQSITTNLSYCVDWVCLLEFCHIWSHNKHIVYSAVSLKQVKDIRLISKLANLILLCAKFGIKVSTVLILNFLKSKNSLSLTS